jgi:hypothetical protein
VSLLIKDKTKILSFPGYAIKDLIIPISTLFWEKPPLSPTKECESLFQKSVLNKLYKNVSLIIKKLGNLIVLKNKLK